MDIICGKCWKGIIYYNEDRVLKDGTVIMRKKCTYCDHVEDIRLEPSMFQYKQRVEVEVTREQRIAELEQKVRTGELPQQSFDYILKHFFKGEHDSWKENRLINKGDPILSHSHNYSSEHPVSQKHKIKKNRCVIAVKKWVHKNGKKYGPYPKDGHYFYEVYRENGKVKQRYLGVKKQTVFEDLFEDSL